ncbi:hypothetical protein AVEN_52269-1, partial [Araneus ventricosus]
MNDSIEELFRERGNVPTRSHAESGGIRRRDKERPRVQ